MGVVILGRTRCPLCGQVLEPGQDVIGFPPLFDNRREAISVLSDAAVHRPCLLRSPFAERALTVLADERDHRGRPWRCAICGLDIVRSEDFFGLGPEAQYGEPLARYDWFQAHRACLRTWSGTADLLAALEQVSKSDGWEGTSLDRLIAQIVDSLA